MIQREWIGGLPRRMANLPVDKRGFPVPRFVEWFDADKRPTEAGAGEPDFRVVDPRHMHDCKVRKACWICGQMLGVRMAFVVGPMCCINRVSSEPPSHLDCATFAALNCPFLARPLAKRNDRGLPEHRFTPGEGIDHNPGASAVWVTRTYTIFASNNGHLFEIGEPESITFYAQGRLATRYEVDAAIGKGFPELLKIADRKGPAFVREAHDMRRRFEHLFGQMAM